MKILYTTYAMYINQKAGIHVMYVYYIATEQYKFSVLFCFFLSLLTLSSNPLKYTANILSMLRLNSCRLWQECSFSDKFHEMQFSKKLCEHEVITIFNKYLFHLSISALVAI
jgi:hypothetical protein